MATEEKIILVVFNLFIFLLLVSAKSLIPDADLEWKGPIVEGFPEEVVLGLPLEEPVILNLVVKEIKSSVGVKVFTEDGVDGRDTESNKKIAVYTEKESGSIFKLSMTDEGFDYTGEFTSEGKTYHLIPDIVAVKSPSVVATFHIQEVLHVVLEEIVADVACEEPEGLRKTRMVKTKPSKIKRFPKQDLLVEAFAVVDYYLYKEWLDYYGGNESLALKNILQYFDFLYEKINRIYNKIKSDRFTLSITLTGIFIFKNESENLYQNYPNGQKNDSVDVLLEFNGWIEDKKKDNETFPNFDVSTFFTGSQSGLLGKAFVGRVCRSYSTSIVRDVSVFSTITVTAHEIGHLLGASHDGLRSKECRWEDGYLMASYHASKGINVWRFSNCSIRELEDYLYKLNEQGRNCLLRSPQPEDILEASINTTNQGVSLDKDCQLAVNDGAACGEGKKCLKGECVAATGIPTQQKIEEKTEADRKYRSKNVANKKAKKRINKGSHKKKFRKNTKNCGEKNDDEANDDGEDNNDDENDDDDDEKGDDDDDVSGNGDDESNDNDDDEKNIDGNDKND